VKHIAVLNLSIEAGRLGVGLWSLALKQDWGMPVEDTTKPKPCRMLVYLPSLRISKRNRARRYQSDLAGTFNPSWKASAARLACASSNKITLSYKCTSPH
jgi:hypothetical protein